MNSVDCSIFMEIMNVLQKYTVLHNRLFWTSVEVCCLMNTLVLLLLLYYYESLFCIISSMLTVVAACCEQC